MKTLNTKDNEDDRDEEVEEEDEEEEEEGTSKGKELLFESTSFPATQVNLLF